MSDLAVRNRSARQRWAAPGGRHDRVIRLAGVALPVGIGVLAAFLVMGQGAYFIWREHTARRAPSAKAADHARPSVSTINAGWVSLFVAGLVWMAAYRGLLG